MTRLTKRNQRRARAIHAKTKPSFRFLDPEDVIIDAIHQRMRDIEAHRALTSDLAEGRVGWTVTIETFLAYNTGLQALRVQVDDLTGIRDLAL